MRKVDLTRSTPPATPAEALRVQKLTGHLWARLKELEEDGLRVLTPAAPGEGAGLVQAALPTGDTAALVQALEARWQVLCRLEAGAACFALSPDTTFEALDYVQDAVYKQLLNENRPR